MTEFKALYQSADWKSEKHVPVIDAPEKIKKGEALSVSVTVGKEIAHPNKTEHHISWVELYFHPQGEKFPSQIARAEFSAHGASAQGVDTSTIYTNPTIAVSLKTDKPGTLYASSYCNIHGLWESSQSLAVE